MINVVETKPKKNTNLNNNSNPSIFLIDDDPTFVSMMKQSAKKKNITIFTCSSIEEINTTELSNYDVAIIDYDLGGATGLEIANYISHFNGSVPTMLISQSLNGYHSQNNYPNYIDSYVLKKVGIDNILNQALIIHNEKNK